MLVITDACPHRQQNLMLITAVVTVAIVFTIWISNEDARPTSKHSKSLPYLSQSFVGRQSDVNSITSLILDGSGIKHVSIIGPPGFGKSTLAIHVGHTLESSGIEIHYVDMNEVDTVTDLAIKIIDSANETNEKNLSQQVIRWVRRLDYQVVFIFDNCDLAITNSDGGQFHKYIVMLLTSARSLQLITTSRQDVSFFSSELHHRHVLHQLSLDDACELLGRLVRSYLTPLEKEEIATLTGCVPLALQIVGAIFDEIDSPPPHVIISQLKGNALSVLSPTEHTGHTQMNVSIYLSYKYLNSDIKLIGQYLSYFPGSFSSDAACYIIQKVDSNWNCTKLDFLHNLSKRSLLQYSEKYHTYKFPILIKKFFKSVKTVKRMNSFWTNFSYYYSMKLEEVILYSGINLFNSQLQANKYNFHKVLHMISCLEFDVLTLRQIVFAMHALLKNEQLCTQLGNEKLLKPVTALISKLESLDLKQINYHWVFGEHCAEIYSTLVLKSYSLSQTDILETKFEYVKSLIERSNSSSTNKAFSAYVAELSQYYHKNGRHSEISRINTDLVKKMEYCQPDECDYSKIGYTYFTIGDYETSIQYCETALRLEQLGDMSIVEVLHFLYKGYTQIGKPREAILAALGASERLQRILDSNDFSRSTLLRHTQLVKYYLSMGNVVAAFALQVHNAKMLQSLLHHEFFTAWLDIKAIYYGGHYKIAAELARVLQKAIKHSTDSLSCIAKFVHVCPHFEYACLQLLKGISVYKSSNTTKGLKIMASAVQHFDVHGCTTNIDFVKEACKLLWDNMHFSTQCYAFLM